MRRCVALALLVTFSWIGGLGQDARAGTTIDVVFQDATSQSGITINAGDPGPGCAFGGYYGRSATSGRCMDLILKTTDPVFVVQVHVAYESDNGLAVGSFYEWKGVGVSWSEGGALLKSCIVMGRGPRDTGAAIRDFNCAVPLPVPPGTIAAGTYRLGTIIWDTSSTTAGSETIAASFIKSGGVGAIINGNVLNISDSVVLGSAAIVVANPEPGTAALLGLGFVGLTLAARRRRG